MARMKRILHEDLSRKVIGTAMDVLNELKPGLDEKLYERALIVGLRLAGHQVDAQKMFPVLYRGELVGNLTPDLIVDEKIIVDPKVVAAFNEAPIAQMVGYLAISGLELALLLNFKNARLEWKRVIRDKSEENNGPDLHA